MKKIIALLITLFFTNNILFAQSLGQDRFDLLKSDEDITQSDYAIILYGENNNEEALSTIMKIREYDRTPQDWLILGNILQDNKKNNDAIFMYKKAITTNKKYYKAYYNLGNIYYEENKLHLAVENYKLATKYNNNFAYAYYNLGCAYLELGQIKKAKYAFIKAIEIKNTVPNFHYNLAYVYKKLKKEKLAKQYLENYNQLILSK